MTDRQDCPFRHENGNCLRIGGFCLAINDEICAAIRGAYSRGVADAISFVNSAKEIEKVNGIKRTKKGRWLWMPDLEMALKALRCLSNPFDEERDCDNCSYDFCSCVLDVTADALELLKAQKARVLPLDEVMETAGSGWLEEWIKADPEDGTPETHELLQAAWCHGDVVFDSSYSDAEQMKAYYLKPYGVRIWNTRPTEAEMEAAPWTR